MSIPAIQPAAPAPPPLLAEADKYDRMCAVWDWLQGLGCCRLCGLAFALMQVEKETGNPTWQPHLTCELTGGRCKEIAREHWKQLPLKAKGP
jgi:hypothetical protein